MRTAIDLTAIGPRTITIDCDVLEADGGTRTASITGGFVALALAVAKLAKAGGITGPVLAPPVAATSVGYLDGQGYALDLVYVEDSKARVDLNVVATQAGNIVEVQGTAEGEPVPRKDIDAMMDLALSGIARLTTIQCEVIARAGVDLASLSRKAGA